MFLTPARRHHRSVVAAEWGRGARHRHKQEPDVADARHRIYSALLPHEFVQVAESGAGLPQIIQRSGTTDLSIHIDQVWNDRPEHPSETAESAEMSRYAVEFAECIHWSICYSVQLHAVCTLNIAIIVPILQYTYSKYPPLWKKNCGEPKHRRQPLHDSMFPEADFLKATIDFNLFVMCCTVSGSDDRCTGTRYDD